MKQVLRLSSLNKTWIFDLDGTLVRHNGYKNGTDEFLSGAKDFLLSIPEGDAVIILTSRPEEFHDITVKFLNENHIKYHKIIFNIPIGERLLFNDNKPSGLRTSYAVTCERDQGLEHIKIIIDDKL
jgi:hypothetical protein